MNEVAVYILLLSGLLVLLGIVIQSEQRASRPKKFVLLGNLLTVATSAIGEIPSLSTKFVSLGNLEGRTESEIIAVVGPPTTTALAGRGRTSLLWDSPKYRISLIFNGEICEGIQQEAVVDG